MSSLGLMRRFRRADVRNVSYVELLFVIIFALLLVLTFTYQDVDEARAALGAHERKMAAKEAELAQLKPLADDKTRSRLRNMLDLDTEEKALLERVRELRAQLADLKAMAALEPNLDALGKVLEMPGQADPNLLLAEATRRLEKQQALIAELQEASGSDRHEMARRLAERSQQRDALAGQVASLTAERDQARRELTKTSRQSRHLERELARLRPSGTTGGGRGLAPCWEDDQGDIVPTFDIVMGDSDFSVNPIWPDSFETRARSIAAIAAIAGRTLSKSAFRRLADGVKQHGRKHTDGACVYYADISDRTTSKQAYKTQRGLVEGYFYPFKVR